MATAVKVRHKSPRGNWLVVKMRKGKIEYCTWVRTWAGVQASKRNKEKSLEQWQELENRIARNYGKKEPNTMGRVFILDIERMLDYAVTEGANEINDLHKLWERE
jgi:hypothetical protein